MWALRSLTFHHFSFIRFVWTFLAPQSYLWSFHWSWGPSLSILLAAAPPASAASTVWTWTGSAWPSLSSVKVSTSSLPPTLPKLFSLFRMHIFTEIGFLQRFFCLFSHSPSWLQLGGHWRGGWAEFCSQPCWGGPQRSTGAPLHGVCAGIPLQATASIQRGM